jgi:rhodanese-related sulfurtransferase
VRLPVTRVITPPLLLIVLAAAVLGLSGCGGDRVQDAPGSSERQAPQITRTQKVPVEGGGSYTDVGAGGLAKMLKAKNFPLVNVHVPYEGEIAQTDRFIPYDRIGSNLDKLPADKDAKVVLYCRSGSMSAIAARELVRSGYTNVWNLDGGMIGWQEAGRPIIKRER